MPFPGTRERRYLSRTQKLHWSNNHMGKVQYLRIAGQSRNAYWEWGWQHLSWALWRAEQQRRLGQLNSVTRKPPEQSPLHHTPAEAPWPPAAQHTMDCGSLEVIAALLRWFSETQQLKLGKWKVREVTGQESRLCSRTLKGRKDRGHLVFIYLVLEKVS